MSAAVDVLLSASTRRSGSALVVTKSKDGATASRRIGSSRKENGDDLA